FINEQLVPFFFGASSFDEVANLPTQGVEHLQHLVVRLDNLAVIKRHHTLNMSTDANRKSESAVQTYTFGNGRAWKILVLDDVVDPDGLATCQHSADEVDSGKENCLPSGLFEFFDFISRNVPAAFNVKCVGVRVHDPQLAKLPTDGLGYV